MNTAGGAAPDFSLVIGGPLYRLWRRSHLAGDALQLVHRRMGVMTMLAWLPLLVLSAMDGTAVGGAVGRPFLLDLEVHARLLVALPLLIYAELHVHRRMRTALGEFLARDLIPAEARDRFDAAIGAAARLRDSVTAEVLLLLLVYSVGVGIVWRLQSAPAGDSWLGAVATGHWQPTPAGWWLVLVSLPMFQFVLLRWYFRIAIWARMLWQISRIDLQLQPLHPDRCGGTGFLAGTSQAFAPVLLAQGVLLSGMIANRVFFSGASLPDFKLELAGLVGFLLLVVLAPLFCFSFQLAAAKRAGVRESSLLAHSYVQGFDRKWLRGSAPAGESLLGSADIQSLADLGNIHAVVTDMRWFPFTLRTIAMLAIVTLLPVAPLLLTVVPLEELLERLVKIVF